MICEKMDVIDIEDETIDAKILNAMSVTQAHFKYALGVSNPLEATLPLIFNFVCAEAPLFISVSSYRNVVYRIHRRDCMYSDFKRS